MKEHETQREQVTEVVQLICLRHAEPLLLSPVRVRRGRRDAAPRVSSSKADLKQRFLIRPRKGGNQDMEPCAHVKDQSQG